MEVCPVEAGCRGSVGTSTSKTSRALGDQGQGPGPLSGRQGCVTVWALCSPSKQRPFLLTPSPAPVACCRRSCDLRLSDGNITVCFIVCVNKVRQVLGLLWISEARKAHGHRCLYQEPGTKAASSSAEDKRPSLGPQAASGA